MKVQYRTDTIHELSDVITVTVTEKSLRIDLKYDFIEIKDVKKTVANFTVSDGHIKLFVLFKDGTLQEWKDSQESSNLRLSDEGIRINGFLREWVNIHSIYVKEL